MNHAAPTIQLPASSPLLLRVSEAARQLGFSRAQFYKMIAKGEFTVVRYNHALRIPAADLTRWIAAHTSAPKGAAPTGETAPTDTPPVP